jgi:hypothetical protein
MGCASGMPGVTEKAGQSPRQSLRSTENIFPLATSFRGVSRPKID